MEPEEKESKLRNVLAEYYSKDDYDLDTAVSDIFALFKNKECDHKFILDNGASGHYNNWCEKCGKYLKG